MALFRLGDIAPTVQGTVEKNDKYWLLNLDMVESGTGRILGYNYVPQKDIGNSTVAFDTGNVLYSKLRPYLNKVVLPQGTGYATSEMVPLRPDLSIITREYLTYYLRSPMFVSFINSKTSGAKMPRAKMTEFNKHMVDVPALDVQNAVTSRLDELSSAKEICGYILERIELLIKTRFVELFGDPVLNPKGWEKKSLSDEAVIKIGPFGSLLHKEDYINGGHPLVNPSHIIDGRIVPDDDLTVSETKYSELAAYHLKQGDVVMGRRGEMGRCAVVDQPGFLCGTGSLIIRSQGGLSADYIQRIISFPSFKRTIEDMAIGQTMSNLNEAIVSAFQIIVPPKDIQEQYYAFTTQANESRAVVQAILDKLKTLQASLMQEYFG